MLLAAQAHCCSGRAVPLARRQLGYSESNRCGTDLNEGTGRGSAVLGSRDLAGFGDLLGDLAELDVAMLRDPFQHFEGLAPGDLVAVHDDAHRFADALGES